MKVTAGDAGWAGEDALTTRLVSSETIRELSVLHPYHSTVALIRDWCIIAMAIALSEHFWNPFLYLASVIIIAGRQHALGILMHEAAHFRLSRNRQLNEALGDVFCAWPVLSTVAGYRRTHLAHHRAVNTNADPDWALKQNEDWNFPKTWSGIIQIFLQDLSGLRTIELFRMFKRYGAADEKSDRAATSQRVLRIGFYILFGMLFTIFGVWREFLLYWLVPFLTFLKFFIRWRSIAEHFGLEYGHPLKETRTTYGGILGPLLIAPNNSNYHLDHHLYPSVPYYNLGKLHRALLQNETYRTQAHITRDGYIGVLRECTK